MEDLLAALGALESEDRDMIVEAIAIAAKKWRREAADARMMADIGEVDRLVRSALTAREEARG